MLADSKIFESAADTYLTTADLIGERVLPLEERVRHIELDLNINSTHIHNSINVPASNTVDGTAGGGRRLDGVLTLPVTIEGRIDYLEGRDTAIESRLDTLDNRDTAQQT
jgi:hypothetical protein